MLVSNMTAAEFTAYINKRSEELRREAIVDELLTQFAKADEGLDDDDGNDDYVRHMKFECHQGRFI